MTKVQRERLKALPRFLQPKLRLFLSADLVGSTASKQRPRFPITDPGKLWSEHGVAPPWLSPIANFFGSVQEEFVTKWRLFKTEYAPELNLSVDWEPTFWKANGDELIFVEELNDRRVIFGCIRAWLDAVKSVRKELIKVGLDVKATAWTAGFPVTNSELVFRVHPAGSRVQFEDDARLQQFELLQKWYGKDRDNSLVMDYIGPSIDTGFRLASHSTPRRFVISMEVAYFLATSTLPVKKQGDRPHIFYSGTSALKGVLGGKPYPIFWIDTMVEEALPKVEDRLLGMQPCKFEDVANFCEAFFKENEALMFLPFMISEDASQYPEFPLNYLEAIERLHEKWQKERHRYRVEMTVDTQLAEQLSPSDSEKKQKEIMDALIKSRSSSK